MNPYELAGPQFIILNTLAMAAAVLSAAITKVQMSKTGTVGTPACADPTALRLEPYDYAVLSGGRRNAYLSAIASLAHRGIIEVTSSGKIAQIGAPTQVTDPLERAIVSAVARDAKTIGTVFNTVKKDANFDVIEDKLSRYGLILGTRRLNNIRLLTAAIVALPLFLGVPKLAIGASAGRPIGFLIFEVLLGLFFVIMFAVQRDKPTDAGRTVLKTARDRNSALQTNYQSAPYNLAGADLVLGAALFGSIASTNDPYMRARTAMGSGSCGSVSSSGCGGGSGCGGSSSSCGGGGGCGGGGCGGCGG